MIDHLACLWSKESRVPRAGWCRRPRRRLPVLEGLEARTLLSGTPTVYTVDSLSDTGTGSGTTGDMLYAVRQANANTNPAGSVIQFDPMVFSVSRTITLTSSLNLTVTAGPVVIDGPGSGLLTVSGGGNVQVFAVAYGVTATISDLTISNGLEIDFVDGSHGGGLLNDGGTVILSGAVVSKNQAAGADAFDPYAGLDAEGGGIAQLAGTLTLIDDTVSGNQAFGSPGVDEEWPAPGYHGASGLGGGLYVDGGSVTILNSTFTGNAADGGTGGSGVPGLPNQESSNGGVGGAGSGGGLYVGGGTVTLVNATLAGNLVKGGAGGVAGGPGASPGAAGASTGGGLDVAGGSVTLYNTIVATNDTGAGAASDIAGTVTGSFNLIGTGGSGGLSTATNGNLVFVTNPGVGPLANYGGLTPTMQLLPGSPALDAGSVALAADPSTFQPLTTDQRGPGFVRINDGTVDIGAYEHQPPANTGGGGSSGSGPATISSVSVGWGTQTDALETAADGLRLLPAGRKTDLPWYGINTLDITLSQPETLTAGEISLEGITGIDYGPVTVSGSGTSYAITFGRPIDKADRVTVTIAGQGITTFARRLDVLPGDFYDSGVVTKKDITAIHNEATGKHGAQPTIFGEILGDGTVNANDYKAARKFQGDRLPKLPKTGGKPSKVALARWSPVASSPFALSPFAPRKDEDVPSPSGGRHIGVAPFA
jgi:hypothetical protein